MDVIKEVVLYSKTAILEGGQESGHVLVDADCDLVVFALDFGNTILDPAMAANWQAQVLMPGSVDFTSVKGRFGRAVGDPSNEMTPSILEIDNPKSRNPATGFETRRYPINTAFRLLMSFSGPETGVDCKVIGQLATK